jgi:hypothetical protein
VTPSKYRAALKSLGITIVGAALYFGIGRRQAQRIAAGTNGVPKLVAKVIELLIAGKLRKEDLL